MEDAARPARQRRLHFRREEARGAADRSARGNVRLLYLRRLGYIFIARNYMPLRAKGELDLVGFDGDILAIVEVRTRLAEKDKPALPEMSVTAEKHEILVRTAHYFLRERHIEKCPVRFDVVGIDNVSGKPPVVRLHKAALSPEGPRFHWKDKAMRFALCIRPR